MEEKIVSARSEMDKRIIELGHMYPHQLVEDLAIMAMDTIAVVGATGNQQDLARLRKLAERLGRFASLGEKGKLDDASANQLVFDYPEAAGLVAKVSGW